MKHIQIGQERLFEDPKARIGGRRVGLIVNPTSVGRDLVHLAVKALESPHVRLTTLFGPEHGIWGAEQDMISVQGEADPVLGIPIFSLYGSDIASLKPPAGSLDDVDVLVFDIQDVGSRYYTYIYTMMLAMEAAAEAGVDFIVLDRPNPIGGAVVEGNVVHHGFDSFVGMHPLANRHGMTAGELAHLFKKERQIDVNLTVIQMKGWTRDMWFEEAGIPWVMPSPNMPTVDTAVVYPGMCLLEGTEMSEGRGTTRPFELYGAPWLDGYAYAEALNSEKIPGALFRATSYRPTFQKHGNTLCGGVQLHVTNREIFRSMQVGVASLYWARKLAPQDFQWRREAYEFVDEVEAIDLLFGTDGPRVAMEDGATVTDIMEILEKGAGDFMERRSSMLLYGERP